MPNWLRARWLLVLLAGALGGWIAYAHGQPIRIERGDVVSIHLQPIPEGPRLVAEEDPGSGAGRVALSEVIESVPVPLPHPAWQFGCSTGGNMIITLTSGRQVTYGPCRRPSSINHLWAVLIDAISDGRCRPNCGPGGEPGP